jgi:hypothetical protein
MTDLVPAGANALATTTETAPLPHLASEEVVLQAPLSFTGSAVRIWKITRDKAGAALYGMAALAVVLIALAWTLVLSWYCTFGLLLVPYRLLRRGSRKRRKQALQHREQLTALERLQK